MLTDAHGGTVEGRDALVRPTPRRFDRSVGPGQHIYCIFVRAAETMPGCCSAPQALLIRKHHATVANLQFSEAFDVSPLLSNTTVSRILF